MSRRRSANSAEVAVYAKVAAVVVVILLLLVFGIWSLGQSPDAVQ